MSRLPFMDMTDEILHTIHTDPKMRNAIAYPVQCCDKYGNFLHFKTVTWPQEYIVTPDQMQQARDLIAQAKADALLNLHNTLLFVGMGATYTDRNNIGNHRIRTEFYNSTGRKFFIEVCEYNYSGFCIVPFSMDRDLEEEYQQKYTETLQRIKQLDKILSVEHPLMRDRRKYQEQPYYNYGKIQNQRLSYEYTKEGILKMVNKVFDCNFELLKVDNYTLSNGEFTCISPK